MLKFRTAVAFLLMMLPLALFAQNGKFAQIKGKVTMENAQGEPVSFATVHLLPQDVYASTELDGSYVLKILSLEKHPFLCSLWVWRQLIHW